MDETELFQAGIREYRAGNYEEAGELLQNSLELNDQNPKVWNTLGIVFTKVGQYDEAATCFENALMLDPGNETFEKNNRIIATCKTFLNIKYNNSIW
ncbi:tetratricopeptide repeat protein [Methanospirillum sp. J.3.6.1-F.2.7.3]|uniref:Tetratricopeptide repeat protein n=1 Tax=Methanospirillum purgamenti TaxID=2834276 RepID=A0A8E7B274_9EURY|nr:MULTISPECIES: tetratricopeptide repeat protein [Methanospirillum]MDX8551758.1 tetratricopeptide repeat protein [Methanospirillum hungatei]QVV89723.1 tetratricopeptide repeat protein [Methanospirillum sp. J.3.6.1-F.2.7.3]